jgi:glutathione S-transferase
MLEEPVFAAYAIAASIMILKMMSQGWITVVQMMKNEGGFLNPEDAAQGMANPKPRAGQLDPYEDVERSRRMHRNDMENIPMFLVAGFLFTLTNPPLWLAQVMFYGFVTARFAHFWAYFTAKSHETRATFFTFGSLIIMGMAGYTLFITIA